jgi:hypothetical protein
MTEVKSIRKATTLFDENRDGPLTDQELYDLKLYSFQFLLDDGDTGRMALLLNKLIDMIEDLEKQNGKLKEMFRVHMLRLLTNLTHEDIDNHIEEALKDD